MIPAGYPIASAAITEQPKGQAALSSRRTIKAVRDQQAEPEAR